MTQADAPDRDDAFHRAAHPAGRLSRILFWVAAAAALAFRHHIGLSASLIITAALVVAFIALRDRTPSAKPNTGLFWRIAVGEEIWKAGGAPAETAKSIALFGKFALALALAGVFLSAWLGPAGLFASFAYLVVTIVKYRMLAALGDAVV